VLSAVRADGQGPERTLIPGAEPAFTPDNRSVVYTVGDRGRRSLWVARVDVDGGLVNPQPLGAGEAGSSSAATDARPREGAYAGRVSPDGRYVAYTSTDTGQPEVHLRRFADGGGHWQVSFEGGREPRWVAATGELVFIAGTGSNARRLVALEVGSGSSPTLTEPITLFSLPFDVRPKEYAVTPDGQRFLMIRDAEASHQSAGTNLLDTSRFARITVVQNWFQEFMEQR
jgi:hypothetical protein